MPKDSLRKRFLEKLRVKILAAVLALKLLLYIHGRIFLTMGSTNH